MITFAEGGQMLLDSQGRFDGQIYVADGFVDTVGEDAAGWRDHVARRHPRHLPVGGPGHR